MDISNHMLYGARSRRAGVVLPSIAILFSIIIILAVALSMVR